PLWVRPIIVRGQVINNPGGSSPVLGQLRQYNRRHLQSAIAGMFNRILVETEPTTIQRAIPADNADDRPGQALMDYHAVIASRCSRFEVYWSDGTRWRGNGSGPIDLSGDGSYIVEYSEGDIVWFGINTTREDYENLTNTSTVVISPEIPRGTRNNLLNTTGNGLGQIGLEAAYDTLRTGAAENQNDEYVAIWGYRVPGASGRYESGAWVKPRLLKFRMTLHDSQFRLR